MAQGLDHGPEQGWRTVIFVVTLLMVILSAGSVAFRLASRLYVMRQAVKIHDYLIVLAWVSWYLYINCLWPAVLIYH